VLIVAFRGGSFEGFGVKFIISGEASKKVQPGEPAKVAGEPGIVRPGSSGTVWTSKCAKGEAISGSCIQKSGAPVSLQNIGPNGDKWECAWTAPVEATVTAVCLVPPQSN
jgi:hypothetical protein